MPRRIGGRQICKEGEVAEDVSTLVNIGLQRRIAALQRADRLYWRDIIAELRSLRNRGALMPEGSPV
jgi:hypothetical protein